MPDARRSPRFVVASSLVLFLVLAGVLVKWASRYLPPPKPNRLIVEYSPYVRAGAVHALDWYPFSHLAFEVARSQQRPVFLEIGTSFSRRSQSLTHYAFYDGEFLRILRQQFVCVRVDGREMPWVAEALAMNTPLFTLQEGSVIAVLDSSGGVYAQTPYRSLYAVATGAGLMDWTTREARVWVYSRDEVVKAVRAEAESRRRMASQTFSSLPLSEEMALAFARNLYETLKDSPGSLVLSSGEAFAVPLNPAIPALLLETGYSSSWWLEALIQSPCYDWVEGGFFVSSVEPGWRRPQFAKATGHSALLAWECARTGTPLLSFVAGQTFDWILKEMVDSTAELVMCGQETDEGVREYSAFYEWREDQLPVEAKEFFGLGEGRNRWAPLILINFSGTQGEKRNRFLQVLQTLREIRKARPSPAKDRSFYADVLGQVLASLYGASLYMRGRGLEESAEVLFRAGERIFVQPSGSVLHAPTGRARVTGYLGDYVWMARAALEKYRVTGDANALHTALRITERMRELFSAPGGGFWNHLSGELALADFMVPFRRVVDDPLESSSAVAIRNLRDLAYITRRGEFWEEAQKALEASGGLATDLGIFGTGYFRSLWWMYQPAIVAHGVSPREVVELQRSLPRWSVLPAFWGKGFQPGYYWVEGFTFQGPFGIAEIKERVKTWEGGL